MLQQRTIFCKGVGYKVREVGVGGCKNFNSSLFFNVGG